MAYSSAVGVKEVSCKQNHLNKKTLQITPFLLHLSRELICS